MNNLVSKQIARFTGLSARKPAHCAGYWVETNTPALGSNSIEQDPMHTASFYKDTGN